MEKEARIPYEAPSAVVLYVRTEGIVCQSPGGMGGRGGYDPTDYNPFGG